MGELVLNQVEGKEFFLQLKWFISALIPNIPAFHSDGINQELFKDH